MKVMYKIVLITLIMISCKPLNKEYYNVNFCNVKQKVYFKSFVNSIQEYKKNDFKFKVDGYKSCDIIYSLIEENNERKIYHLILFNGNVVIANRFVVLQNNKEQLLQVFSQCTQYNALTCTNFDDFVLNFNISTNNKAKIKEAVNYTEGNMMYMW